MTKNTIFVKVYDNAEAEREIRKLKKLGYKRIQNAYWIEHWKKNCNTVILERDF